MGGVVAVHHDAVLSESPEVIKHLFDDDEKVIEIFTKIAKCVTNRDSFNSSSTINIKNLVNYFLDDTNTDLHLYIPDKQVILTAHKHCCRHIFEESQRRKKKRNKSPKSVRRISFVVETDSMSENINKENLKFLLATMYLYSHIWKVFHIIDELVIKDMKVTKDEFIRSRVELGKGATSFLTNLEVISEEEWLMEYDVMDINKVNIDIYAN